MKKLFSLLAAVLLAGGMSATVYNAVKVTSVQDGHLYIIERDGKALIDSVKNYIIYASDNYTKVALQGNERYVWLFEGNATEGFTITNNYRLTADPTIDHNQLSNQSSSANVTLANYGGGDSWWVTFTDDVALISLAVTDGRFIGEQSPGVGGYKAYASSNLGSNGHDFTIYELQEATGAYLATNVSTVDFGNVRIGDEIDPKTVKVLFGGLTGSVTYSGLTAPLSATGTIENDGDEITINIEPTVAGNINQTLVISSATDGVNASVTIKATVLEPVDPSAAFALYTGDLVEGDYVIYSDGVAMNTTVTSDRLQFTEVTPVNDAIEGPTEDLIWHIAPAGAYWTIFSAAENKYAASTGVKNKAQLLASGTDDKSLWTATKNGNGFDFTNKANTTAAVNAVLRKNQGYGFACYAASTGGALSLYKKGNGGTTALDEAAAAHKAIKRIENGQIIIIRDGKRFNAIGARIE